MLRLAPARAQTPGGVQAGGGTAIVVQWQRPDGIPGTVVGPENPGPFGGIMGYVVYRIDLTGGGVPIQVGGTLGDIRQFRDQLFFTHDVPNVYLAGAPGSTPIGPVTLVGVPGLIAGHVYQYRVQAVYHSMQDWDGDGAPDDVSLLGPLSGTTNPVTAILVGQILSLAQGQPVDPANLVVTFTTTSGADRYQVLVSTDVWFRRGTVASSPLVSVPPDRGGPTVRTITMNASRLTRRARQGQLFVTVRARASRGQGRGVTYPPIEVSINPPPPPGP
jgi:hypothetical protein